MPAPFIPVPDTARATMMWSIVGQIVEITLGFLKTGGWDAASLDDLTADLFGWFTGELIALLSNQSTLININATDQSSDSAPSIDRPIGSANVGTNGSTPAALNATVAIKFITAQRGRSYRGRNYFPILPNNGLLNAVTLTTGEMGAILSAYAALPSYLVTSGAEHVVISRYHDLAPRVTGVATPVIGYSVDQSVDSQRRRLAGRGI